MIKGVLRPVAELIVPQLDYEATQQTGACSTCPTYGKAILVP
ncbi:4-hydroxybenzoate octaprenyltransferase [Vibrio sp. MED222]|nr:4-hydroxybenzoate octaprenyltransferase [Vibrio sp. MED222]